MRKSKRNINDNSFGFDETNFSDPGSIASGTGYTSFSDTGFGEPDMIGNSAPAGQKTVWDKTGTAMAFVFGIIGTAISAVVFRMDSLPMILRIGLICLLSAGLPLTAVAIRSAMKSNLSGRGILTLFLALILLFGAGSGLEFLYELGSFRGEVNIDDYIFLIDDSGSMADTDPKDERGTALRNILDKTTSDNNIGMILFNDSVFKTVPMDSATDNQKQSIRSASEALKSNGGTDIQLAVDEALSMIGKNNTGRTTMMVLLTDGESSTPLDMDNIIAECRRKSIVIVSVGMSNYTKEDELTRLAKETGGMYYKVDDPQLLQSIYGTINYIAEERDLVTERIFPIHQFWAGVLRIIAWLLIGLIAGVAGMMIPSFYQSAVLHLARGIAGGLLVGLLYEFSGIQNSSIRIALLLLLALIPMFIFKKQDSSLDGFSSFGSGYTDHSETANKLTKNDNGNSMFI